MLFLRAQLSFDILLDLLLLRRVTHDFEHFVPCKQGGIGELKLLDPLHQEYTAVFTGFSPRFALLLLGLQPRDPVLVLAI